MSNAATVELLAPAGGPRALRAALAAGADAVYFGLERWSARAFAGNFAGEAVVEAVETAHLYDARAYLALNTHLKDDEVGPALAALQAPYLAGLDALIVADLGFALRVREAFPDLPLHASTQAGAHSSTQLAALARLGFSRAILARELSLAEIAALDAHGLELETFVHGALCYGYSGDCLLSSMVGGRSGNRGRCSQSCRLRYGMTREGSAPDTGGEGAPGPPGRVMSTADLAAIDALPQLAAAGVSSFKIEGRMKDAAYVAVTTAVYREALDEALADPRGYVVRPEWRSSLEQSFSRGFTAAHLEGRHHEVRSGGRGGHRGVLVGRVARVDEAEGTVDVRLSRPVTTGDVVYFYTPWGQSEPVRLEEGGDELLVMRVRERVTVKDRLFRLAAAHAGRLAGDLVAGRLTVRPLPLHLHLSGREGERAVLTATPAGTWGGGAGPGVAGAAFPDAAAAGAAPPPEALAVSVSSAARLTRARTAALSEAKAREALRAFGGTPYSFAELEFAVADGLFLGVGDLKDLRRRAVARLDELRLERRRRPPLPGLELPPEAEPAAPRAGTAGVAAPAGAASAGRRSAGRARGGRGVEVVLVLRPRERPLDAPGVTALCLDVLVSDGADAVAAAATTLVGHGLPLRLRLPEILFDGDEASWRALLALPWQAVHARHLGVLAALHGPGGPEACLEYPLQMLNGLSPTVARALNGRAPEAVVVSPESSLTEIAQLPASMGRALGEGTAGPRLEILAFGRQQVLRTRDQLGRAEGLVPAPSGCEHAVLVLEDAKGFRFPADVDAGGTRLFNARVTNLAANLDELREAGVGTFHVVQADMDEAERHAFVSGGLPGLAACASRERSTTGHLFRGVA